MSAHPLRRHLFRGAGWVAAALKVLSGIVWHFVRWNARHWRWLVFCVAVAAAYVLAQRNLRPAQLHGMQLPDWRPYLPHAVAVSAAPGVVMAVWQTMFPRSHEVVVRGPMRRMFWRRWARRNWVGISRECGLAVRRPTKDNSDHWVAPKLLRATTAKDSLRLIVRTRVGQTVDDLTNAVPAIGAAARATSTRCAALDSATVQIDLVMRDSLAGFTYAELPADVVLDQVPMGRRQDNTDWHLQLRGRHTLVVGCSGSGKGSVLWGICGGLGPAAHMDVARLWAIDLKRGVEVTMGAGLFSVIATSPADSLAVLRALLKVIDERGRSMAGWSRLHEPRRGDPMHVLVIDELAALTAYGDTDVRREANRLLAEILTQGRALGVVVVACVQDPRKEVVGMRGLFTQTIALRLRSADETRMVLGDGMAGIAPAHRISSQAPGTAWIVDDEGNTDRVRADFWPDGLIRQTAAVYRSAYRTTVNIPEATRSAPATHVPDMPSPADLSTAGRKPRLPRRPLERNNNDGPIGRAV